MTNPEALRYTFKYHEKLHRQIDFKNVLDFGRRFTHPAIFVYSKTGNSLKFSRLGLVTSGKIGNAVTRNRCKRLIREVFRLNKYKIKPGTDIIFMPKTGLKDLKYLQIEKIILSLLNKAGVLLSDNEKAST